MNENATVAAVSESHTAHSDQLAVAPGQEDAAFIKAYCALEFTYPSPFTFYIRTLCVSIGRRTPVTYAPAPLSYTSPRLQPVTSATRSTSPLPTESQTPNDPAIDTDGNSLLNPSATNHQEQIKVEPQFNPDVDLGPIKAISRDHAALYYDKKLASWALEVRGRNGVVVQGKWLARGEIAKMGKRTRIQIGERIFYFVLPEAAGNQSTDEADLSDELSDSEPAFSIEHSLSALEDDSDSASGQYHSRSDAFSKRGIRGSGVARGRPTNRRNVKRPAHYDESYALDGDNESEVRPKKKARTNSSTLSTPATKTAKGKAKSAANTFDVDHNDLDKPPYSYASLVAQAIDNAPISRGTKKMTSAAICDWIAAFYPYYARNPEGLAWQNSIQQALSNNNIFQKMPRQADEPGKGNFWVIDPKLAHLFDGLHLEQASGRDGFMSSKSVTNAVPGKSRLSARQKAVVEQQEAKARKEALAAEEAAKKEEASRVTHPKVDTHKTGKALSAAAKSDSVEPVAKREDDSTNDPIGSTPATAPIKIVLGPPPSDWTPPTHTEEAKNELAKLIRKENPIILHNGTITLSPIVFKSMKSHELDSISKMERTAMLKLLQQYMIEHFKSEIKKSRKGTTKRKGDSHGSATPEPTTKKLKVEASS